MRIAHVVATIVLVPISGFATLIPWIAPNTDCAGVKTPSLIFVSISTSCGSRVTYDITMLTPNTPRSFRSTLAIADPSIKVRTFLFEALRSLV